MDTAFLNPPPSGGLRDNVRCSSWSHWKALSGLLISVNWTFFRFLRFRRYERMFKIGDFAPTGAG